MESFVAQMNQKPLLFPIMLNQQVGMPRFQGKNSWNFNPRKGEGWTPSEMAVPIHGL